MRLPWQHGLKHMRRFAPSAKPREIFNARHEGLAKFPAKNQAVDFRPSDCRIKHPARRRALKEKILIFYSSSLAP